MELSLSPTQKETQISANVQTLCERANSIEVWDEDSANACADIAKFISSAIKIAEDERKSIVSPFNNGVKAINNRFKKITDPLNAALAVVKGRLLTYQVSQRKIAEASAVASVGSSASATAPVRSSFGTASIQKRWTFKVKDISLVDPQFLVVNNPVLMDAIRSGLRDTPGIEIYQEDVSVIR